MGDIYPKACPVGDGCSKKSVLGMAGTLATPGLIQVTPSSSGGERKWYTGGQLVLRIWFVLRVKVKVEDPIALLVVGEASN